MFRKNGGGGGIRTPEGLSPTDLQSASFGRLVTPPHRLDIEPLRKQISNLLPSFFLLPAIFYCFLRMEIGRQY